jgi:hypothetical protein
MTRRTPQLSAATQTSVATLIEEIHRSARRNTGIEIGKRIAMPAIGMPLTAEHRATPTVARPRIEIAMRIATAPRIATAQRIGIAQTVTATQIGIVQAATEVEPTLVPRWISVIIACPSRTSRAIASLPVPDCGKGT